MRIFLVVLFLIFTGCEVDQMAQNTKPTITEFETPDGNVADPPATVVTNGYIDGDIVNPCWATEFNKFRREHARLGNYILADTRTIYAGCTSGNDTTGTGTFAKPYKTIGKAYEMVAPFAYTEISLMESGDYLVSADITQRNKQISIVEFYTITAHVKFVTYEDTWNKIYQIGLYGVSWLNIAVTNISVNAPVNTAVDWDNFPYAIKVYGGMAKVNLTATSSLSFSATGTIGTDYPAFVGIGIDDNGEMPELAVTFYGAITTNSNGYAVEDSGQNVTIGHIGTMDDEDYWLGTGVDQNQILATGDLGSSPSAFKVKLSAGTLLSTYETASLPDTTTDGNIKTAIEALLNANIAGSGVTVAITSTRDVGGGVTSLSFNISGAMIPDGLLYIGVGLECYFQETQTAKRNINVQTNIDGLK